MCGAEPSVSESDSHYLVGIDAQCGWRIIVVIMMLCIGFPFFGITAVMLFIYICQYYILIESETVFYILNETRQ